MKHFIFTYDRFETITTSEYLKSVPHVVLCHTEEQKENFTKAGRIHGELIATLEPKGLSNNRNFALSLMEPGEWACFWVDDLIEASCLQDYFERTGTELPVEQDQPAFRKLLKYHCDVNVFNQIAMDTIKEAESKGFALCGFSLTDNPLFRKNKFQYWSLADGRCWLVKKTHLRFDTNVQLIDDTCFTALNLKTFGGVVVNNWMLPNCERYKPGAYGTKEQRMEQKIAEAKYLVDTYPDFVCYGEKVGWPEKSHVKIRQKKININQQNLF